MPKARNLRYYRMALALLVSTVTVNALVTDCAERHPKLMENKRVHGKEAIRLVVCGHPQDKVCHQVKPDPIGNVSMTVNDTNTEFGFFNVQVVKEDDPKGAVDFICSFDVDPHRVQCVRTYLHGSLEPSPGFKGPWNTDSASLRPSFSVPPQ